MRIRSTMRDFLRRLHRDQRGAVSLETVLIIGAIAVPILIFLWRFVWPWVKNYLFDGLESLESETEEAVGR